MREKWRVLQNEAEVLTSSAKDKEKWGREMLLSCCVLEFHPTGYCRSAV